MNGKIFRENDRLIGSREVEDKKSCHRQLISCFLASLMSLSAGTVVAGWSSTDRNFKEQDLKNWTTEQESVDHIDLCVRCADWSIAHRLFGTKVRLQVFTSLDSHPYDSRMGNLSVTIGKREYMST